MPAVALRRAAALSSLWAKETLDEDLDVLYVRQAEPVESSTTKANIINTKYHNEEQQADEEDSDFVVNEGNDSSDEDSGDDRDEVRRELKWLLRDQEDADATAWLAHGRSPRRETPLSKSTSFQMQFWEETPPTENRPVRRSMSFVNGQCEAKRSVERRKKSKKESIRKHRSDSKGTRASWEWDAALSWAVVALFLAVALVSQAHAATRAHDELCLAD